MNIHGEKQINLSLRYVESGFAPIQWLWPSKCAKTFSRRIPVLHYCGMSPIWHLLHPKNTNYSLPEYTMYGSPKGIFSCQLH
jgi:hypothetical protein